MTAIGQALQERRQFEKDMQDHVARLCEYARPYVAALIPEDRIAFLDAALAAAWRERKMFNPQSASLYQWWERCLRSAALTRDRWYEYDMHGRQVAVLAERLGRGGRR